MGFCGGSSLSAEPSSSLSSGIAGALRVKGLDDLLLGLTHAQQPPRAGRDTDNKRNDDALLLGHISPFMERGGAPEAPPTVKAIWK